MENNAKINALVENIIGYFKDNESVFIAEGLATEQDLEKIKKQIDEYISKLFAD